MKIRTIVEAKTFPGKILYLKFTDGVEGQFCFTDYFQLDNEMCRELLDDDYFSKVFVDRKFGCISWPNEYDPSPSVLYAIISKQKIIWDGKVVFDPALGKNSWL